MLLEDHQQATRQARMIEDLEKGCEDSHVRDIIK